MDHINTKTQSHRTINLPADLHRELKIAAANRLTTISGLVAEAWQIFKEQKGDQLHDAPTPEPLDVSVPA
jgi:hypothetical protein